MSAKLGELHVPVAGPGAIHGDELLAPGARRLALAGPLERRLHEQRHLDRRRLEHVPDALLGEVQLQGQPPDQLARGLAGALRALGRGAPAAPRAVLAAALTRSINASRDSVS